MPIKRKYRTKRRKLTSAQKKRISKAARAMKSILYTTRLQQKLNRMTLVNHFFGTKCINEMEEGSGSVVLQDNQSANELPLAMISLRAICNNSHEPSCIMKLKSNGYGFLDYQTVQHLGTSGNVTNNTNPKDLEYRQLLHNYTQVKLLLYQNNNRDAVFNVKLIRLKEDQLNPHKTGFSTSNTETQKIRKLFYKYLQLRSITTNPLIKNTENLTTQIRGMYNTIWSKTYKIEEKSTDFNEVTTRQVNIFRRFNKVVNYAANPEVNNTADFDNPETIVFPDLTGTAEGIPSKGSDNLFLIITANCTIDQTEDATGYDLRTFDVLVKSKYTTTIDTTTT